MSIVRDGVAVIERNGAELVLSVPEYVETVTSEFSAEVGILTRINEGVRPAYTGPTTITPSDTEQILETENMTVLENITINPIPSNYGLITWNGSTLTVS